MYVKNDFIEQRLRVNVILLCDSFYSRFRDSFFFYNWMKKRLWSLKYKNEKCPEAQIIRLSADWFILCFTASKTPCCFGSVTIVGDLTLPPRPARDSHHDPSPSSAVIGQFPFVATTKFYTYKGTKEQQTQTDKVLLRLSRCQRAEVNESPALQSCSSLGVQEQTGLKETASQ